MRVARTVAMHGRKGDVVEGDDSDSDVDACVYETRPRERLPDEICQ